MERASRAAMWCCCWRMTWAGATSLASATRPPGPRTSTHWWPPPSAWPPCTRPPPSAPPHAPPSWQVSCDVTNMKNVTSPGQYPVSTGVWPGVFTPGQWQSVIISTDFGWLWCWLRGVNTSQHSCAGDLGGLEPGHPSALLYFIASVRRRRRLL